MFFLLAFLKGIIYKIPASPEEDLVGRIVAEQDVFAMHLIRLRRRASAWNVDVIRVTTRLEKTLNISCISTDRQCVIYVKIWYN